MKTTSAKVINKSSHLKVVGLHFLLKIKKKKKKKNSAKEVYLGKIAIGKITACNFAGTFHCKTNAKDH